MKLKLFSFMMIVCLIWTATPIWAASSGKARYIPSTPAKADWIGKWDMDVPARSSNQSTILIVSIDKNKMKFSLHATYTNSVTTNLGDISLETAIVTGNKAVFTDKELNFRLEMTLDPKLKKLSVSAVGESPYFGHNVTAKGKYAKTVIGDFLIVPGKSVGKIKIGMTRKEVTRLLGKPTKEADNVLTYKSSKSKNYVSVYMNRDKAAMIEFTSPSFMTVEGIGNANFEQEAGLFRNYEFQWRFLQKRYEWKTGGLTFFMFNADAYDHPDYERYSRGYVYAGTKMYREPISDAKWKAVSP